MDLDSNLVFFSSGTCAKALQPKWHAPNSLRDSNVNPKQKTTEEQGVKAHSLARNILEG
jgi:hypothetical protein